MHTDQTEQSDLGTYCLQYRLPKNKSRQEEQTTKVTTGLKRFAFKINAPIATSRLLFSSAEMFKKTLLQTVWTQIRLLL